MTCGEICSGPPSVTGGGSVLTHGCGQLWGVAAVPACGTKISRLFQQFIIKLLIILNINQDVAISTEPEGLLVLRSF